MGKVLTLIASFLLIFSFVFTASITEAQEIKIIKPKQGYKEAFVDCYFMQYMDKGSCDNDNDVSEEVKRKIGYAKEEMPEGSVIDSAEVIPIFIDKKKEGYLIKIYYSYTG